jgi:hypothetical protein
VKEILENNLDRFFIYCYAILIAILGGVIRVLTESDKYSVKTFIVEGIIAAFSGIIMFHLIAEFNFNPQITSSLCGIAGFSGREFVYILKKKFAIKIKKADL